MTLYRLYLESVDYHSTTMVHVPNLLGCVAVGPTTEAALDAIPEAVNAFRRFLLRAGELVELDDAVDWDVVEHVTSGDELGYGSPTVVFGPDRDPLTPDDTVRLHERHRRLDEEVARWAPLRSGHRLGNGYRHVEGHALCPRPLGFAPAELLPHSVSLATTVAPAAPCAAHHALRLSLEHKWMLLVSLSRRPGGPRF